MHYELNGAFDIRLIFCIKEQEKKVEFLNFFNRYLKYYKKQKNWNSVQDSLMALACLSLYESTRNRFYLKKAKRILKRIKFVTNTKKTVFQPDDFSYLYPLYRAFEVTRNTKFHKQIFLGFHILESLPKTDFDIFTYRGGREGQVHLESMYSTLIGYCAYQVAFDGYSKLYDIINQVTSARKNMFCDEIGLYHCALDQTKEAKWADRKTGLSNVFDLQELGFYLITLVELISLIPKHIFELRQKLIILFKEIIHNLVSYQNAETLLFYRDVINADDSTNFLETSGSAMVAYAIIKACRIGVLHPEKYSTKAIDIINTILNNRIVETKSKTVLTGCCERDSSHSYLIYGAEINNIPNEPIGVAALALAFSEMKLFLDEHGLVLEA